MAAISPLTAFEKTNLSSGNFSWVEKNVRRYLEPLYGPMTKELFLIGLGKERACEIIVVDQVARGLFSYLKTAEYEDKPRSLIITSFLWTEGRPEQEVEKALFEKMKKIALSLGKNEISLSLSDRQREEAATLNFLGFEKREIQDQTFGRGHALFKRLEKRKREEMVSFSPEKKSEQDALEEHALTLPKRLFQSILSGRKTKEARLISLKEKERYHSGDRLIFRCEEKRAICVITTIAHYDSPQEMLEKEGVEDFFPFLHSVNEALQSYFSLPALLGKRAPVAALHFFFIR